MDDTSSQEKCVCEGDRREAELCIFWTLAAPEVHVLRRIKRSVFSEAFLVLVLGEPLGRSCVYIVDFACLSSSVLLDFICLLCCGVSFASSSGSENEAVIIVVVLMMVPIDRA